MNKLEIAGTSSSPAVNLNPETGEFVFSGRSLPEDPMDFFKPVLDWFEEYKTKPINGAIFEFKLTYFNTASSKVFFSLIQIVDQVNVDHPEIGNRVLIHANVDDEDLIELFEYYKELLSSNCLELKTV